MDESKDFSIDCIVWIVIDHGKIMSCKELMKMIRGVAR